MTQENTKRVEIDVLALLQKLWTKKATGEKITLLQCNDGSQEVNTIIEEIIKGKNQGKKYRDFTILYRMNAQSRLFEEGFLRFNIPYKIFGGMQFYQRAGDCRYRRYYNLYGWKFYYICD